MFKYAVAALSAFVFFAAQVPQASAQAYVDISVGQMTEVSANGFSLSDDITYGAAAGIALMPNLRVQGGFNRLNADFDLGGFSAQGQANDWNVSAFYDIPLTDNTTVFVGGGVDYVDATVEVPILGLSAGDAGWGYSLEAGLARDFGPVTGAVSVRRLSVEGLGFGKGLSVDLEGYEVAAHLRFAL